MRDRAQGEWADVERVGIWSALRGCLFVWTALGLLPAALVALAITAGFRWLGARLALLSHVSVALPLIGERSLDLVQAAGLAQVQALVETGLRLGPVLGWGVFLLCWAGAAIILGLLATLAAGLYNLLGRAGLGLRVRLRR